MVLKVFNDIALLHVFAESSIFNGPAQEDVTVQSAINTKINQDQKSLQLTQKLLCLSEPSTDTDYI